MSLDREQNRKLTHAMAFCSLMAALGAALMTTGGMIPVLTYCSPLLAGVLLIPVLREYGEKWAWLTWLVTALLSLILSVDKEAALFYCFLGCYPILRRCFNRVRPKMLSRPLKLLYILAALAGLYALILLVLGLDIGMEDLESLGQYTAASGFLMLTVTMLLYDRVLTNLEILYERRLRGKLKRFLT